MEQFLAGLLQYVQITPTNPSHPPQLNPSYDSSDPDSDSDSDSHPPQKAPPKIPPGAPECSATRRYGPCTIEYLCTYYYPLSTSPRIHCPACLRRGRRFQHYIAFANTWTCWSCETKNTWSMAGEDNDEEGGWGSDSSDEDSQYRLAMRRWMKCRKCGYGMVDGGNLWDEEEAEEMRERVRGMVKEARRRIEERDGVDLPDWWDLVEIS